MLQTIPKWGIYEISLKGPIGGNPFIEVELFGIFSYGHRKVKVRGFYDGEGIYKLRFMPDIEGIWKLTTLSNCSELSELTFEFQCKGLEAKNHGPVKVDQVTHFIHADGKPYYPFGTTAYVWNHQADAMQRKTLASLKEAPFNKIRMCVFPKYYDYNTAEPEIYPFVGEPLHISNGTFDGSEWQVKESGFDFERFNPKFFQKLETQIQQLADLEIEVDLILFHPYDHWGFASMGEVNDIRYLKYLIARLASYRNIWWSMANEHDLMELVGQKKRSAWDTLCKCVIAEDPYQHLVSNHNFHHPPKHHMDKSHWYDHHKSWISHASIQHDNLFLIPEWLEEYRKPMMIDECRYEGNLNHGWGNLTAQDMVSQFWKAICHGAYATHGETYFNNDGSIWWSHGGVLKGESVKRIAFLRRLVEEEQLQLVPLGRESSHWETAMGISDETVLIYLGGSSQASFKQFDTLPDGKSYKGQLIDTWEMTMEPISGEINRATKIKLPGKPYMAILLKEILG